MAHDEFSREEIPTDGVSIGGDDDCAHTTYRRFGSDGGGNIYFRCTNCSNVILNYDSTTQRGRAEADLTPDSSGPKHDPLMKGLSFDSDDSEQTPRGEDEGLLGRLKSDLDDLLRR
jgi:hypothetical protein